MNPVYEMAKKYYPRLWGKERIDALAAAGKLTAAEATEITGEVETEQKEDDGGHS